MLAKPSPDEDMGGGEESGMDDMRAKMARSLRRFFAAGKSGDMEAAAAAFHETFRACEMYEPGDEMDEGDGEEN